MKKKKKVKGNLVIALLILILVLLTINAILSYIPQKQQQEVFSLNVENDPLSLQNYSKIQSIQTDLQTLTLSTECKDLTVTINPIQARSIRNGLEGIIEFRPTSHDILKNTLENFDIKIELVKITELKTNSYYANLFLRSNDKLLNIDSRPSDAIALAVRTNSPIYINNELLEKVATDTC